MTETAISATAEAVGARPASDKVSIVMFSGTADKFIPLGVLAQAGAAMGMEVRVFVTGFALHACTKERHELPFPAELVSLAPAVAQGMSAAHVAPWDDMLRQAKELGAKVYQTAPQCPRQQGGGEAALARRSRADQVESQPLGRVESWLVSAKVSAGVTPTTSVGDGEPSCVPTRTRKCASVGVRLPGAAGW
ncbi:MAG: DsrE/DsrF/DrsH-like family protein [Acidimicrobiales bacterium]